MLWDRTHPSVAPQPGRARLECQQAVMGRAVKKNSSGRAGILPDRKILARAVTFNLKPA